MGMNSPYALLTAVCVYCTGQELTAVCVLCRTGAWVFELLGSLQMYVTVKLIPQHQILASTQIILGSALAHDFRGHDSLRYLGQLL